MILVHNIFSALAVICVILSGFCMAAFPIAMLYDHRHPHADAALHVLYALLGLCGALLILFPLSAITAP